MDKTLATAIDEVLAVLADLKSPKFGTTPVQVLGHLPTTVTGITVCVDIAGCTWDAEYWRLPVRLYTGNGALDQETVQALHVAALDVIDDALDAASLGADGRCYYDPDVSGWAAEWVVEVLR